MIMIVIMVMIIIVIMMIVMIMIMIVIMIVIITVFNVEIFYSLWTFEKLTRVLYWFSIACCSVKIAFIDLFYIHLRCL